MIANELDKKANIRCLTALFPHKYGYARRVAERLADKKSIMGRTYTDAIVYQVLDKGYDDPNVEPELVKLAEEYAGKPIHEAAPNYVP